MLDSCKAIPAQRTVQRIDARIRDVGACRVQIELVRVEFVFHHFLRLRIEKNVTTTKNAMMPMAHGIHIGAKTQPQFKPGQTVSFKTTKSTVSHKRMIVAMSDFFI